jgi:hypothetical protein
MVNLLDENYVRSIIYDIETSQNRERRRREIRSNEIYSGKLRDHVEDRLKQIYPNTYNSFSFADLNLTKKIVDKAAKAYKQNPIRELDTDQQSESYSSLMQEIDDCHAWQTFDVYYNLHRYAAMWFNYYEDTEGEMKVLLRPLAPFQFSRVVNRFNETEVFIVNFPSNDLYETTDTDGRKAIIQDSREDSSCSRYAMWSKDHHVVIRAYTTVVNGEMTDCRIKYEDIPGNNEMINALGVIPAAFAQQGDNFALPILNPLPEQTVEFNQQYSVMLTGSSLQTFGHLVLSHPEDQKMPDEIYNSLFTYSRLPQKGADEPATTLDYLNPSPNLDSQLQVLQNYAHQIITEHLGDGSQNIKGSSDFTSGLDRLIAMSDITNIIESNQQVYAKVENQLYQIIKSFYEAMNDFRFSSESITVKYPKAKPALSEKELLENIKKKLDMGLIQKYEALLALDPNMSVEAAMDKIEAVKEEKAEAFNEFVAIDGEEDADQEE